MAEVQSQVKEFILANCLQGEDPRNLTPTTELIRSGILDSLATLELVTFLEERFDIELGADDVGAENLGTLESIERLVHEKRAPTHG